MMFHVHRLTRPQQMWITRSLQNRKQSGLIMFSNLLQNSSNKMVEPLRGGWRSAGLQLSQRQVYYFTMLIKAQGLVTITRRVLLNKSFFSPILLAVKRCNNEDPRSHSVYKLGFALTPIRSLLVFAPKYGSGMSRMTSLVRGMRSLEPHLFNYAS